MRPRFIPKKKFWRGFNKAAKRKRRSLGNILKGCGEPQRI
jgi:hypothetical protein